MNESALAAPVLRRRPGRHPEHPTAEEGCRPASRGLMLVLVTVAKTLANSLRFCQAGTRTDTAVGFPRWEVALVHLLANRT